MCVGWWVDGRLNGWVWVAEGMWRTSVYIRRTFYTHNLVYVFTRTLFALYTYEQGRFGVEESLGFSAQPLI